MEKKYYDSDENRNSAYFDWEGRVPPKSETVPKNVAATGTTKISKELN